MARKKKNYIEFNSLDAVTVEKIADRVATLEIDENFTFDVFLDYCRLSQDIKPGDKVRLNFIFEVKDGMYIEIEKLDDETKEAKSRSIDLQNQLFG